MRGNLHAQFLEGWAPAMGSGYSVPASRVGSFPPNAQQHRFATDCERPCELARFSQLLYYPKCVGISRHIEMQDLPPVVADDEKAVQNTKREGWDGK